MNSELKSKSDLNAKFAKFFAKRAKESYFANVNDKLILHQI